MTSYHNQVFFAAFCDPVSNPAKARDQWSYQITILKSKKLGEAFVLVYGVVVGNNAFAIN